jgi:hypothetical protein
MAIRLTLWDMESLVDVGIRRYFTHDSKCGQMGDCEDSPKRAYDCTGQCWMLCAAVVHRLVVERVSANLSIKISFFLSRRINKPKFEFASIYPHSTLGPVRGLGMTSGLRCSLTLGYGE